MFLRPSTGTPGPGDCSADADCTVDRPDTCVICGNGKIDSAKGACPKGCIQEQCDQGSANGNGLCSSTCQMAGRCITADGHVAVHASCATDSDCNGDPMNLDCTVHGPCTCQKS